MALYDHECQSCGKVTEAIMPLNTTEIKCECGNMAKRIISCGRCYTGNEDAAWLRSVLEVVDKGSDKPETKEFLKHPTRSNYKAWMRSEGIRPMENNEPTKPPPTDISSVRRKVWENHQRRNRIEI